MSMPSNDSTKTFDPTVYIALAWKVIPLVGGLFAALGFIPKSWVEYMMDNQAALSQSAAGIIAGIVTVYTVWKNLPSKRVADVAAIPGVTVDAPKALATSAQKAATPAAAASITSVAA